MLVNITHKAVRILAQKSGTKFMVDMVVVVGIPMG